MHMLDSEKTKYFPAFVALCQLMKHNYDKEIERKAERGKYN